jgi:hypothetical protein
VETLPLGKLHFRKKIAVTRILHSCLQVIFFVICFSVLSHIMVDVFLISDKRFSCKKTGT